MAVPAMVWQWDDFNRSLDVFALADPGKPREKTVLYHAPFHNVYPHGDVCVGTGGKHISRAETFEQILRSVMKVFWTTAFSEIHNKEAVKGNLNTLHHKLITTAADNFPIEKLIPTGKTLNDLL